MTEPRPFLAEEVERHAAWMRRLARAVAGEGAADDVVQDAWTTLGERRERPGYLAAIVRTLALRHRRGEQRRARRQWHAAPAPVLPSAADVAARSEILRALATAVDELDEPYRTTVVLRYYDELTAAEIARRADVPAATVRSQLARGLDQLRARLDARGGRERWLGALLAWVGPEPVTASPLPAALSALLLMKLALSSVLVLTVVWLGWNALAADAALPASGALGAAGVAEPDDRVAAASAPPPAAGAGERVASTPSPAAAPSAADATAASVLARAVDTRRRPVPGAWLRVRGLAVPAATGAGDGALRVDVERAALERLAGLDRERFVDVELGARGHRTRTVQIVLPPGRAVLHAGDVVLEAGGSVHGRVVDPHGAGIEGALVVFGEPMASDVRTNDITLRRGPSNLQPERWALDASVAVTGASGPGGGFHLDGVPVGYGTLWARTRTSLWTNGEPVGVRAGEAVHDIELVVRDAAAETISGRVVDPDGRPVPGLELSYHGTGCNGRAQTDERGDFHVAPVVVGPVDLHGSAPDDGWESLVRRQVAPGTHGLVLAFAPSQWLRVLVQDTNGAPLPNGTVTGLREDGSQPPRRCVGGTGGDGIARVRRPAEALRVRVAAHGCHTVELGPFEPATFADPLVVTLQSAPALSGCVRLPDGRPAAGAVVTLHPAVVAARGAGSGTKWHLTHQAWGGDRNAFVHALDVSPAARVITDADGRFRMSLPGGVAAGDAAASSPGGADSAVRRRPSQAAASRWYVHAARPGMATATSGPLELDAARDTAVDLQLPPGGSIAGKLLLDERVSPAGWTAYATDGLVQIASAAVGADGRFRFESLHAGGWQIRAFEPGRVAPGAARAHTERAPVPDVRVEAGCTVEHVHVARPRHDARVMGRLLVNGRPPGAALVTISTSTSQAAFRSYRRTLDPDGGFEIGLESGLSTSITVTVQGDGTALLVQGRPVVVPGVNEWTVDVATAQVTGELAAPVATRSQAQQILFGKQLVWETSLPATVVRASWDADANGRFGPIRVAAGPGVLRGPRQNPRDEAPVLLQLELAPGETRDLGRF